LRKKASTDAKEKRSGGRRDTFHHAAVYPFTSVFATVFPV
jgi:hypothetical protein